MVQAVRVLVIGAIVVFTQWAFMATVSAAPSSNPTPSPTAGASVRVDPASAAQGGQVRITVSCPEDSNGRVTTSGEVSSAAFPTTPLQPAASGGGLYADVTVSSTIAPGSYPVNAKCANGTNVGTYLAVYAVPTKSGPPTGGGFLAHKDTSPLLYSGVALIGVSAGLGIYLLRRRSKMA